MMLDIAETLDPLLDARARRVEQDELDLNEDEDAAETTLQLIFFDGEEAFVDWTETDSVYGARCSLFFPPLLPSHPPHTSPQTPRRNMGNDLPPSTPKAPPPLRRIARNTPLDDRAPHPPRSPRRRTPARALLLSRHGLALRRARQRRDASARRGHPRRRCAGAQLLPLAHRGGPQLGVYGR